MYLPNLVYSEQKTRQQVMQFLGLNLSDNFQDGHLQECRNLSSRRFPYLATRLRRLAVGDYVSPTAVTAWNKLVVVDGTSLIYDGKSVGEVTAGEKQFAVVNTKLVIFPDKKYLDLNTATLHDLGASVEHTGAEFTTDSITMTGAANLTELFSVGDGVTISGCKVNTGNNKTAVIKAVAADKLTFSENSLTAGTETESIQIVRKIPDMDYICESENRLWGVSNEEKTIYASALGDPKNFFVFQGISTDAYSLAVGSSGNFTGCCKLASSVLFWKENLLHKILGSYPAEYALYTSDISGVQEGGYKSMAIINDTLFYKAPDGVYAYSGGTPTLVSQAFGAKRFSSAVAGTDGMHYYLSAQSGGKWHLLVYDTQQGIWVEEDNTHALDFCRYNGFLYMLSSDGSLWSVDADAGDEEIDWSATFTPFYETMQGKKVYSSLYFRFELEKKAWIRAEVRCDGGRWENVGILRGEGPQLLPVRPRRCDRYEIRLSGKGACAVLGMVRKLRVGSEV